MQDKKNVLENVDSYSPEALVRFIQQGVISYDELVNDNGGRLEQSKLREVKSLYDMSDKDAYESVKAARTIEACQEYLNSYPDGNYREYVRDIMDEIDPNNTFQEESFVDDSGWENVDQNDIDSLKTFVSRNPDSIHAAEANNLIDELIRKSLLRVDAESFVSEIHRIQTKSLSAQQKMNETISTVKNKITKAAFLKILEDDHNLLSAGIINQLLADRYLSLQDLKSINIDEGFLIKLLDDEGLKTFTTPEKLERIHKQSTEVYFWGIPSSGKSCALGAILSVAYNGTIARSMAMDVESQGYGYMTRLIHLFKKGDIGSLMTGTDIDAFYEMGFDLVDADGKIHPITCIDMAGELMRCMYKSNAKEPMSDKDLDMLDTLTKVLIDNRSQNRKMHFFVIEYGAEDRLYEDLPQSAYLDGALSYIENTGIFDKDTDAIFIMVTKVDKIKDCNPNMVREYINDNYLGFYNGLTQICENNGINKGKVEHIAFSLGDVCFQNYCRFDSRPAENAVKTILKRSANYRGGKRGFIGRIFRG